MAGPHCCHHSAHSAVAGPMLWPAAALPAPKPWTCEQRANGYSGKTQAGREMEPMLLTEQTGEMFGSLLRTQHHHSATDNAETRTCFCYYPADALAVRKCSQLTMKHTWFLWDWHSSFTLLLLCRTKLEENFQKENNLEKKIIRWLAASKQHSLLNVKAWCCAAWGHHLPVGLFTWGTNRNRKHSKLK